MDSQDAVRESRQAADFTAIAQLSDAQVDELYQLYQREWWSQGRQPDDICRMLAHSDEVFGFCEPRTGRLVAFARVLTDYVYRATVYDVIVAKSCRGSGLGRRLVEAIVSCPQLQSVERIQLDCRPELVEFYAKWGFHETQLSLHTLVRSQTCEQPN
ncbi:GNAT family N-acetyltransferase [Rubidibacter lacunae]|nr:GNAT family N-acetyltransferase [Rubidibacter lacunae]